jgi:hypothetical protein
MSATSQTNPTTGLMAFFQAPEGLAPVLCEQRLARFASSARLPTSHPNENGGSSPTGDRCHEPRSARIARTRSRA